MSAVLKIRSFKGTGEPGEDPEEYLDDVQMAAEAWENGKGDAAALEKSLLRFFRQNLEPNYEASWWWGGLTKEEKTVWTTVKSLFLKKFADPVSTGNDVNYEETYEVLGLSQKAGQSIEEYIREAEHLHRKVRPVLKQTLAAAVIKGLADEQKRAIVSFALDGTTYDFNGAIDKIKASYRSIGEPDPFTKHSQKPWPATNPFYSAPGGMGPPPIPVMAAIGHRRTSSSYESAQQNRMGADVDRPATSDGLANTPGSISQEDFNKYMDAYLKRQKGQDFQQPSHGPSATAPAVRGANPWVTCFTCGQRGHRSMECSGILLSREKQIEVRERVAFEVQEYRARKAAAGRFDTSRAFPASGANAVAMGSNQVMERRLSTENQDRSSRITAAFAILHRIPGVMQAVRNAAMALKRDGMEAGLDSQDNDRVTPACGAPTANPWNQPEPEEQVEHMPLDSASHIPAATRPRVYAPTKLMQKEPKYDLEAVLRSMFAGRLCTGGGSVARGGVGVGGASTERVGVGGGGKYRGASAQPGQRALQLSV
jgi:hypothetical protein